MCVTRLVLRFTKNHLRALPVSPFRLATPPGFDVTHIPKANLVCIYLFKRVRPGSGITYIPHIKNGRNGKLTRAL